MRTVDKDLIPALLAGTEVKEVKEAKIVPQVLTKDYCDRMGVDMATFAAFLDSQGLPYIFDSNEEDSIYKTNTNYNYKRIEQFSMGYKGTTDAYLQSMRTRPSKISTGIAELDEILSGGFCVGINSIGGTPGAGKTTLLVNCAVNMSRSGTPCVYLTHDMRSYQLIDKVYSKVSYEKFKEQGYTLTDIGFKRVLLKKDQKNQVLIDTVMEQTKLLTIIDMLDTKELVKFTGEYEDLQSLNVVERIIKMYSSIYQNPVIFIDSLQQMAGYLGVGAKEGIDRLLMMIKEYSAKYKVAIVLVSTLSRAYYNKDLVIESFKESGNIEYDSDQIFVLQGKYVKENADLVSVDDYKSCDYRDITIKCLKSRDSGFISKDITLFAPYCSFIPFDEERSRQQKLDKGKAEKSDDYEQKELTGKPIKVRQQASKPKPVNVGFSLIDD